MLQCARVEGHSGIDRLLPINHCTPMQPAFTFRLLHFMHPLQGACTPPQPPPLPNYTFRQVSFPVQTVAHHPSLGPFPFTSCSPPHPHPPTQPHTSSSLAKCFPRSPPPRLPRLPLHQASLLSSQTLTRPFFLCVPVWWGRGEGEGGMMSIGLETTATLMLSVLCCWQAGLE